MQSEARTTSRPSQICSSMVRSVLPAVPAASPIDYLWKAVAVGCSLIALLGWVGRWLVLNLLEHYWWSSTYFGSQYLFSSLFSRFFRAVWNTFSSHIYRILASTRPSLTSFCSFSTYVLSLLLWALVCSLCYLHVLVACSWSWYVTDHGLFWKCKRTWDLFFAYVHIHFSDGMFLWGPSLPFLCPITPFEVSRTGHNEVNRTLQSLVYARGQERHFSQHTSPHQVWDAWSNQTSSILLILVIGSLFMFTRALHFSEQVSSSSEYHYYIYIIQTF